MHCKKEANLNIIQKPDIRLQIAKKNCSNIINCNQ